MAKRHHYVEVQVTRSDYTCERVTRLPMDSWSEARQTTALLAADLFPEDENALYACTNGVHTYNNINDLGDFITIRPMISPYKLPIGETMCIGPCAA